MALEQASRTEGRPFGSAHAAEIGPNAVLQIPPALDAAGLRSATATLFAAADAADWLAAPPHAMVDETRAAQLHQALRRLLPRQQGEAVLSDAGRRTADYILANRIPRPAQIMLKLLPAPLAARALAKAIGAHAWTFAGSGRFASRAGRPMVFEIAGNPLCANERAAAPVCVWHTAVFQRLFAVLVAADARVVETACEARGDPCCQFRLDWGRNAARIWGEPARSRPMADRNR